MKQLTIPLLVMMVIILVFTACSSDDEPEQYIYPMTIVDDDCKEFHIDSNAQQIEIGIRSNQDNWYLEIIDSYKTKDRQPVEAEWISLISTRAADVVPRTLVFQVESNDAEARKASIYIWSGGKPWSEKAVMSGSIEIYQDGAK